MFTRDRWRKRLAGRPAFSLLELMVVVTIIGLLIAIVLPSLARVREQARQTACSSNLKQIGVACQGYLLDNQDRFPFASFMPSVDPAPLETDRSISIADVLLPELKGQSKVFQCPSDRAGFTDRPPPNTGLSFFESERSSYAYNTRLAGRSTAELSTGSPKSRLFIKPPPAADNDDAISFALPESFIMHDYAGFHAKGDRLGGRRYLYLDGHVAGFE